MLLIYIFLGGMIGAVLIIAIVLIIAALVGVVQGFKDAWQARFRRSRLLGICPDCNGEGAQMHRDILTICETCQGRGKVK